MAQTAVAGNTHGQMETSMPPDAGGNYVTAYWVANLDA
jgi:hypothetical protein